MGKLTSSEVLDAIIAENRTHDPGPRHRILEVVRRSDCPRMMSLCFRAALAQARDLGDRMPPIVTTDDMRAYLATNPGADYLLHLYRQLLAEGRIG